ncbi:MAG: hypothetical protein U9O56_01485 [Campylobacterota bacterium]|nr:hypothetical protein [Campylobacterota bacterium]
MLKITLLLFLSIYAISSEYYYNNGKKVILEKVTQLRSINNDIEYYQTNDGVRLGVSRDILVQCNFDVDCEKILSDFSFDNITMVTNTIFKVTINENQNLFEQSNLLYENKNIKFAHPNFSRTQIKR